MRRIENDCVGCPPELGCLGRSCPNRDIIHLYCDKCKEETTLYHYDGKELCMSCIIKTLEEVERY